MSVGKIRFTKRWLILCEGSTDKAVLTALVSQIGLDNDFQTIFPLGDKSGSGGKSKFGEWLSVYKLQADFKIIQGILLVADKDNDAQATFADLQRQLTNAGFAVPTGERVLAGDQNCIKTMIVLVPIDAQVGAMECLLVEPALTKWPHLRNPIDRLIADTPVNGWVTHKQSKSKVLCIVATSCQSNPATSFYQASVRYDGHCEIPVNHPSFDSLRQSLQDFGDAMNASLLVQAG